MESLSTLLALLVTVGIFYAAYKTVAYTHRSFKSHIQTGRAILITRVALVIAGCVVGFLLASLMWRWSETQMIIGFPIPSAAWEYVNGHWEDFVSPLSPMLWLIDFIIGVALVHLPVAGVFLVKNRKSHQLPKDAT